MNSIKELEREFQALNDPSTDPEAQHAFAQRLLGSDEPEAVGFHYELLRHRDNDLFRGIIRDAFSQRGAVGEKFLLQKLEQEKNPEMLADVVLILGLMQSSAAREYSLRMIRSPHEEIRHVATFVLGWVGTLDDLRKLEQRLLEDQAPTIRSDAATAHYQIFYRIPECKDQAVQSLLRGLEQERDEDVLASILISLQDILNKRFGMHEDIDEGEITGDVGKAKEKALKFLKRKS
ncbi:HEAT repeat domain-containing protein [Archangium sp.]|uniref:HEAT repeat domain-containing protein n=1 Tax=Archangium sp. TaxID=1872627 RepID=UPI002D4CEDBB|nr:HEAT repeat domain-containing protein [Archangium sp.]HYO55927.1 HEAT repeat domain-containing protein [Archangium sp.]